MKHNKAIQQFGIFTVVLSLAVLSCSGTVGLPNPFATETPTPTSTFTPSPTLTPSPTPTFTQTPSPTPLPTGVEVEEQTDGSTLFFDYDNQYQLRLPSGWFAVPLSSEDLAEILASMSEKNPDLENIAEAFEHLDPDVIRVMSVNEDIKYVYNGFTTNLSVAAIEDKLMSAMPLDFVTGALEESLKQQGAEIVSSEESLTANNTNGVEIGTFEYIQTVPTGLGGTVKVHSRALVFQSNGKLIMIQMATPPQFSEEILPSMDEILASIKLIEP